MGNGRANQIRWAIRRLYSVVPFEDYSASA
jgi:hypothetical protein